tara:strand:+ start:322 stop:1068 length:747 start_codon:yes stop_codon:yes gene_type:complete
MTNNAFETHGITYLSPSFINSWVSTPWAAIGKLAGLESSSGPAAYRGHSTEAGLELALKTGNLDAGIFKAQSKFDEFVHGNPAGDKERSTLPAYVENAYTVYRGLGEPEEYQQKIVFQHEDLPIPFVGYIDFIYKGQIRDLKTVARNMYSRGPSIAHCRQLAVYGFAYPENDLWLDYVTPREAVSHRVANKKAHQETVMKIIFGLEKFLSLSRDTQELASILTPDTDDWRFNNGIRNQADDIWPDVLI